MRQLIHEQKKRVEVYLKFFVKWTFLALLAGAVCGTVGAVFHHAVELAGAMFSSCGWLLYLLPVSGLAVVLVYRLFGAEPEEGANLVILSLRTGKPVPPSAAVRVFVSTVLTHLCGGSAGREGAALIIGAGMVPFFKRVFHLSERAGKKMTMCCMSALFSAVFGTPVAAALFSMEVSSVGVLQYTALYPCLTAGLAAWGVSSFLRTEGVRMPQITYPDANLWTMLQVAVLALLCAACAILFLSVIHFAAHQLRHFFENPYIRAVVGGVLVVVLTTLLGRDYNGAGMGIAVQAVAGEAVPWAFLAKILLTAVSIGAGFKGGEIVPAFFIGATFGCTVGPLLGLPVGFAAAVGMVAVFCSVVNSPAASIVLSVELFGGEGLWFFAAACGLSYLMSGHYTLYAEQNFVNSKLEKNVEY